MQDDARWCKMMQDDENDENDEDDEYDEDDDKDEDGKDEDGKDEDWLHSFYSSNIRVKSLACILLLSLLLALVGDRCLQKG